MSIIVCSVLAVVALLCTLDTAIALVLCIHVARSSTEVVLQMMLLKSLLQVCFLMSFCCTFIS